MEMAKIKPPKKKEEPPPIPKFVPLKPNLELLNAPLGQKPAPAAASTEQPKTDKPKPPAPAPVPAAPATIPTTVPTGGTTAGRLQTERQTSSESSSTESISSSAASSSISDNNKATPAQAEEEDEDEYEYYEYESYEEEEEEEPVPPPAPAPQPPKVEYQQQLKTQLFVYSDLLVLMLVSCLFISRYCNVYETMFAILLFQLFSPPFLRQIPHLSLRKGRQVTLVRQPLQQPRLTPTPTLNLPHPRRPPPHLPPRRQPTVESEAMVAPKRCQIFPQSLNRPNPLKLPPQNRMSPR